jgi:hypothetical protein
VADVLQQQQQQQQQQQHACCWGHRQAGPALKWPWEYPVPGTPSYPLAQGTASGCLCTSRTLLSSSKQRVCFQCGTDTQLLPTTFGAAALSSNTRQHNPPCKLAAQSKPAVLLQFQHLACYRPMQDSACTTCRCSNALVPKQQVITLCSTRGHEDGPSAGRYMCYAQLLQPVSTCGRHASNPSGHHTTGCSAAAPNGRHAASPLVCSRCALVSAIAPTAGQSRCHAMYAQMHPQTAQA